MTRYYFHVREDGVLGEDLEGAEFATDELAYDEAVRAACEIAGDAVTRGNEVPRQSFEITTVASGMIRLLSIQSVVKFA